MTAIALDENNDAYLKGGQIARATGADFVVQSIRTRLKLYLGEWWLDLTAGVPWYQDIHVQPANVPQAEATLKATILGTAGVESLISFDATFDRQTRALVVTFEALTIYGPSGVEVISA